MTGSATAMSSTSKVRSARGTSVSRRGAPPSPVRTARHSPIGGHGSATRAEIATAVPSDPRLALVLVEAHSVEYMVTTKPRPVVLFEVAKALLTGGVPQIGDERTLTEREVQTKAAHEARM